jgi:two-component system, OmpR family, sensor histidine kinase VicK
LTTAAPSSNAISERTEVLHGEQNVVNTVLQFTSKAKSRIDACVDYSRPSLTIEIEQLRKAFLDAKRRGVKLRYITEITEDNVGYCKELVKIVDELRHIEGIKGNFYISETEYIAPATFHARGKPASQIIYSNVKEIVEHQQQFVFDSFWSRSIPAEQEIKAIEEGIIHYETRIVEDPDQIIEEISRLTANSNELSTCVTSGGMQYNYNYFFKIKKKLLEKQKKGQHKGIRYISRIEKDNIDLTKIFLNYGIQIRHVKNLPPMSFGVSDKEMSATIEKMEGGMKIQSLLISNEPLYVNHFNSLFEELWKNGIDATERIKDIEEGFEHPETRVLKNKAEILAYLKFIADNANEQSTCCSIGGMQLVHNYFFKEYKKIVDRSRARRKESKGVRWITSVDKYTIDLVKIFLDSGMQVRHVKDLIHIDFAVDNKNFNATVDKMEGGKLMESLLISNEPAYVSHYNSVFEELWKNGIDATERIKDIEAGVDLADIEVIPSSARAQERYLDVVRSVEEEILWIFPTVNAFIRQDKIGAIPLAKEAVKEKNIRVRILIPASSLIEQKIQQLKQYCSPNNIIDIRYIVQMSDTKATILVVDRKASLVMELKDDSKATFIEAIGLSTYSNSKAGVLSYVAIFDNLWRQTELYEQVKDARDSLAQSNKQLEEANEQLETHDKMQKEFINIAAHELRTPIQPILGLTENLLSNTKDIRQVELLQVISRSAKRLQRLTEDILDVTKIESQSLNLKKEWFNLNDVIANIVDDALTSDASLKKEGSTPTVKLEYHVQNIFVQADKGRITQVIDNLLSNALKFTKEGTISINLERKKDDDYHNDYVLISVKDTGQGINPEILPKLFTKFATKSETGGTGLGLFISKSIVEAHGGKIRAENNSDGKGATFAFSLPIVNKE